ncbi:hypothetical protein N9878_02225 [bacterium]|nr:hypothetical protein [bacterium]
METHTTTPLVLRESKQIRMGHDEDYFGVEIDEAGIVRAIDLGGSPDDVLGAPELPIGMIENMIAVLTRAKELKNANV